MSEQVLDQAVFDEIIRRIGSVAQPGKTFLSGSTALGQMGRNSDVALLVVRRGGPAAYGVQRNIEGAPTCMT